MRPRSAGCERPGSTCASATDPNTSRARRRRRVLDRGADSGTRSWPRPANAGSSCCTAPAVLARASSRPATRSRSPVRTGRPRRRRCSRSILREAGWSPSFVIGGELNEVGTNAAYGDGRVARGRSRRERRHVPRSSRPRRRIVTNVEPDHLDHYGGFAELVAAFEQFVDAVPGPVVVRHRRRRRARGSRHAAPASARTATSPTPTTGSSTTAADRNGCRFTLAARRRPARRARRARSA